MTPRFLALLLGASALATSLAGCNTLERLSEIGEPPRTTAITDPTKAPGYQPVSLPMPSGVEPRAGANSLWRPGSRNFLKDQRASAVGDIVSVTINMSDSAQFKDQTQTSLNNSEAANPNFTFFGLEGSLNKVLPSAASPSNLFSFGSSSGINGNGQLSRQEQVVVHLAAEVVQKMPNGNLVIRGSQELRVNSELRVLTLSGIIRPADITSANTINSSQIAEARITYGGRGTLSDVQQARYGQQLFDALAPF